MNTLDELLARFATPRAAEDYLARLRPPVCLCGAPAAELGPAGGQWRLWRCTAATPHTFRATIDTIFFGRRFAHLHQYVILSVLCLFPHYRPCSKDALARRLGLDRSDLFAFRAEVLRRQDHDPLLLLIKMDQEQSGRSWEYTCREFTVSETGDNLEVLNALGREGWELVSTICDMSTRPRVGWFYLKRPREDLPKEGSGT